MARKKPDNSISMRDYRRSREVTRPRRQSTAGRIVAGLGEHTLFRKLSVWEDAHTLQLEETALYSRNVPEGLDGLRIAYASDIHYGRLSGEEQVRELEAKINALEADLVILGGDYGDGAENCLGFFSCNPSFYAKYGVFAAIGNHDRAYLPAEQIGEAMTACGITPLINNAVKIPLAANVLAVCGIDDYLYGDVDFTKTAAECEGADYVIFAPHEPDAIPEALRLGPVPFFHLALCGHTHGGQFLLFHRTLHNASVYGREFQERYLSGWHHAEGTDILVSNGVGTIQAPLRAGAPARYHCITLRSRQ